MEHDGVHRAAVHEQDSQSPGVDHGVPDRPVQPGVDSRVLLDEEPVTEQIPLFEQVVDHIPAKIHQFMDRCVHRWCRHRSIILPGTDSDAEPFGVSTRKEYSKARLAEQGPIGGSSEGQDRAGPGIDPGSCFGPVRRGHGHCLPSFNRRWNAGKELSAAEVAAVVSEIGFEMKTSQICQQMSPGTVVAALVYTLVPVVAFPETGGELASALVTFARWLALKTGGNPKALDAVPGGAV